ncbi:MAG TPA: cation transporter [Gemmatimonadaceae bacterium]|nr:cation transporter [Gemmatimonadaceae bacterium]
MSVGYAFSFPEEKRAARERARKLSWLSVVLLLFASVFIGLTVGQSQAMKTAWVSDVLTAIPPIALIVALRYELRAPSERFPNGYVRAVSVAFLVTASVLSLIGIYLLYDSVMKLVRREHPPIGTIELFGQQLWLGWAMIAALFFSMCMGLLLGKLKEPVAEELHSKALQAESEMNRAEWMSEGAAILGILLVAFGFWWGDAAAAAFISLEIVRDGWHNVRQVIGDMMDESPTQLGKRDLEDLPRLLRDAARRLPWVEDAGVRLREHGHTVTGEVFVVPHEEPAMDTARLLDEIDRAAAELGKLDWRLHGLLIIPVRELEEAIPPRVRRGNGGPGEEDGGGEPAHMAGAAAEQ